MMERILLLEDDDTIASSLLYALEKEGYASTHCQTIHEAAAADYITKPFRLRELLARIKRTLHAGNDSETAISLGDARIDTAAGKVYVDGQQVELTATEYRLLLIFAAITFFTVLISAYMPANKAAKISAMDCIRSSGSISVPEKVCKRHLNRNRRIEEELALVNIRRNKRNTRASVTILSVSIILFVSLSGLRQMAVDVENYIYPDRKQTVIVDYISNYVSNFLFKKAAWRLDQAALKMIFDYFSVLIFISYFRIQFRDTSLPNSILDEPHHYKNSEEYREVT